MTDRRVRSETPGWADSMIGRGPCMPHASRFELSEDLPEWDGDELYWPSETQRTRAFRLLQSWYRTTVLKARPGPHSVEGAQDKPVGSELSKNDGDVGLNFLHDALASYADDRVRELQRAGATVGVRRLTHGMLSSMPLAFNLFGHLSEHYDPAARVLSGLVTKIDIIDSIEVEVAPRPKSTYLSDGSAFDAAIEYRAGGKRGLLAIETKYTDHFGRAPLENPQRYEGFCSPEHGWQPGAFEALSESKARQALRNALLACAVQAKGLEGRKFDEVHIVIASAREDKEAIEVCGLLKKQRSDPSTVHHIEFENMIGRFARIKETECWAREFGRRYLDLTPILESKKLNSSRLPPGLRTWTLDSHDRSGR